MHSGDFAHLGVLIVDGRGQGDKMLRLALSAIGVGRVITHAAGTDALAAIRQESYDVVFCSEDIIGMNPVAFLKALRRDTDSPNRTVPIILVSGYLQRRQVELLRDCGANDVLVTPASADAVKRKLRSVVLAPRPFIVDPSFSGPDRRYREEGAIEGNERRGRGTRGRRKLH